MKIRHPKAELLAALAATVIPSSAHASVGMSANPFWNQLIAFFFGESRGRGGGGSGPGTSGVPELGGEGLVAVLVIVLAVVAIVMDRRRRATPAQN